MDGRTANSQSGNSMSFAVPLSCFVQMWVISTGIGLGTSAVSEDMLSSNDYQYFLASCYELKTIWSHISMGATRDLDKIHQ